MDLSKLKFNESDFLGKDVASLPDRVVGRADYLKKMFDNVAKNEIALGRFNSLIDELVKITSPVYFSAKSAEAKNIISNTAVEFPLISHNLGGFELENYNLLKIPESGIYLITFSANGTYGQDKDVRFFIRPGDEGCTVRPLSGNGKSIAGSCSAVLYKEKGDAIYIDCLPLGSFTLNDAELTATLLYR